MTLRIALCLSIALHAVAVRLPLPGGTTVEPEATVGSERLELRLVDPASALGPEAIADGATPAATGSSGRTGSGAAGSSQPARGAPSVSTSSRGEPEPTSERADLAETPRPDAETAANEPATASATPATRGPTLAELESELGLDLSDVADQGQNQIFPVMLKVHLNGGQPTVSTYRQLLRTYIDVLMGYPWAVQRDLARNEDIRFLALLQIEVGGDGRFRVANLLINENVADEDGRIEGFYRRLLDEVAERPFLPPARAGLVAPASLTFQILNPESTR